MRKPTRVLTATLGAMQLLVAGCAATLGGGDDGGDGATDGTTDGVDPMDPDAEGDLPITDRFTELAARIDAERQMLGAPGVSVLMMEHGQVVFAHGFGLREPGGTAAADSRTLYRVGSITKSMTTVPLLGLVAEGKVALSDPLAKHIPELAFANNPNAEDQITIRQLLMHTSGLDDAYGPEDAPFTETGLSEYTTGEYAQTAYLQSPVGRFYNYSNPNFSLAGLVLERAGGVPHRMAVTNDLFGPVGMTRTVWTGEEALADGNAAYGLYNDGTRSVVQRPDAYDNAFFGPAGEIWSSPWDMARYMTFFMRGDDAVLPAAQRLAMQAPQVDTDSYGDLDNYGYGLSVYTGADLAEGYHDVPIVTHSGAIYGFSAEFTFVPSTGFGMVVFANTDNAYFYDSNAYALATFGDLPPATARPDNLDVDESTFGDCVGTYDDPNNVGRIIVSQQGGNLVVSMPDLDAAQVPYERTLTPYSRDNFGVTVEGYEDGLTFVRDAAGRVEYFRTRYFVGRRTGGAGARTAAPAPTVVDPVRLRALLRAPREAMLPSWTYRPYRPSLPPS